MLGISVTGCAQDIPSSKVPSLVQNTVLAKFPGANKIEWEKKKNNFEAEFDLNAVEYNAILDASGNLIQYKKEIPILDVPEKIQQAIQSTYPGYTIDDADLIDKNGALIYELELETQGKKDIKVFYNADGTLISKK